MESGTEMRSSRLFMVIALVLTASLVLGLLGIGGLVLFKVLAGPTEVAMPPEVEAPTTEPEVRATPTLSPLPSATPTAAPTATLVVVETTASPPVEGSGNGTGHDAPGLSSPGPESSEMPQTGLGLLETLGVGLTLICLLGATRVARRLRVER